jgi:hypothetical protein
MHEMKMYLNGNRAARPVVARGVSLAHQTKLSKSQRAVLAADILDGRRVYQPTRVELATLVGVSAPMIVKAQSLSPAARAMIAKGLATLSNFATPKINRRSTDFVTEVMEAAE